MATKKQQRALSDLVKAARAFDYARAVIRRMNKEIPKSEIAGYYTREPGKSQIEAAARALARARDALERAAVAASKALPAGAFEMPEEP